MLEYSFKQLVDLERIQSLLKTHHKITGVCSAILDLDQNILVAEGWEDICTRFHRVHPVTHARCLASNETITHRLDDLTGDYRECKCQNGLWDIAMPILIDGRMVATFFIGQFFYDDEEIDEAFFRAQAAEFGFGEEAYLSALRKVPIFSREQICNILDFYRDLIQVLAESGLKKLRLLLEVEERKKAEEALAAREREFRSLAGNLPDSVARWDLNGRYLYINPTLERALGISAGDCIGSQSPERHAEVRAAVARVAASGQAEHSIRQEVMLGDGCALHNISFVPEFDEDGRIVSVLGIGRDMTKFYRMQETIAAREQEYRSLAESSPDHIVRYDREGRILYLNTALVRRLNLNAAEEVIGKRPSEVWPDGRFAGIEQAASRAVESGAIQGVEVSAPVAGGKVRSDHILIIPERNVAGQIIGSIALGRDVTENKRLETALKESETRLQTVMRTMPDMVWLKDADGVYLFCNHAFERLTGKAEAEIVDGTDYELFDADLAEFFRQKDREAIEAGRICINEEWVTYADDGSRALLETRKVPVVGGDGRVLGVLGVARDITESKRMERELAAREREFRSLAENLPDNVVRWDTCGRYLYINPTHERILGGPAKDYVGRDIAEEAVEFKAAIERVAASGRAEYSIRNEVMVNGDREIHSVSLVPEFDEEGRIVSVLGIGRDMTEFYRLQEIIAAREQEYRSLAESSPDFIVRYDLEGRHLYLNSTLVRRLGFSTVGEVLGKRPSEVWPDGRFSAIEQAVTTAIETGVIQTLEVSVPGEEGEVRTDHILIIPERNVARQITGAIAFGRDITERKRIETELQNKNRELESFTYTVSHDLKSPLITIRGFAGAIAADLAAGKNDRIDTDLQRICNAADKMMTLLDDLLQLSRVGRVLNPLEPVDMTCLANEVVAILSPILQENSAQVSVQSGLPTVPCDRQRILFVLQNLIENAVQYRGEQPELQIRIGLREEGEQQVFFVRDNGAGIAPEYHQHIFGLFNRLNPQVPGNGIGLSLVKRIIEEHGGRVWVESDGEGAGSTFCFSLDCPAMAGGQRGQ